MTPAERRRRLSALKPVSELDLLRHQRRRLGIVTGYEARCCGIDYMYVDPADNPPPIPERWWPAPAFQVDGDWQGHDCMRCGRELILVALEQAMGVTS